MRSDLKMSANKYATYFIGIIRRRHTLHFERPPWAGKILRIAILHAWRSFPNLFSPAFVSEYPNGLLAPSFMDAKVGAPLIDKSLINEPEKPSVM